MESCDIHVTHFSPFLLLNWLLLVYIHTYIHTCCTWCTRYIVCKMWRYDERIWGHGDMSNEKTDGALFFFVLPCPTPRRHRLLRRRRRH